VNHVDFIHLVVLTAVSLLLTAVIGLIKNKGWYGWKDFVLWWQWEGLRICAVIWFLFAFFYTVFILHIPLHRHY
jgi:hypothetical protein